MPRILPHAAVTDARGASAFHALRRERSSGIAIRNAWNCHHCMDKMERPSYSPWIMRGDAVEEIPIADPPFVHQPLIQTIVDKANGQGRCPSTGETAARTARVIEDCLAEFKARRRR
jgi:hypothetical protein